MGTDTYRSATYDFLWKFRSNRRPISYRFRDKLISVDNRIFSDPSVFCAPAEWVTIEIVHGAGIKKLEWWATGPRKTFDDIFRLWLQYTNLTDGLTDGHVPGDSKDSAYA